MYIKFLLFLSLLVNTAIASGEDSNSAESADADVEIEIFYDALITSFQENYCIKSFYMKLWPEGDIIREPLILIEDLFQELKEIYEAHKDSPESLEVNFTEIIRKYKKTVSFKPAVHTVQHFFETVTHKHLERPVSCFKYTRIPIDIKPILRTWSPPLRKREWKRENPKERQI